MAQFDVSDIVVGIISALGGLWLKILHESLKELSGDIKQVRQDYQRRDDAADDREILMTVINSIHTTLSRIETKIDGKADK
ncbi:hypothetical protein EJP80_03200 [Rahnella aquatilis]|nr:hypothetical protein EJP80_03200 [Rahnella aquatilis]